MLDADLARVLSDDFLADLPAAGADGLRARRAECVAVEAKISFLRRLVQGRLDIVSAELDRRASGGAAGDLAGLVDQLPQILADRSRPPGPGRMPTNLHPPDDPGLTAELDAISGPGVMGSLADLPDGDLRRVAGQLQELERRVSTQRQAVFDVIETLQSEMADRFREPDRA